MVTFAAFACLLIGFGVVEWHISSLPSSNQQKTAQSDSGTAKKPKQIVAADSADDRIARYTLWLAIFTGALVIVSGFQGYFLIRADRTARISADAAKKSADNTRKSVEAFIDTERPRVFISKIEPFIKDCSGDRYPGTNVPRQLC
jgi:hypothetical protein